MLYRTLLLMLIITTAFQTDAQFHYSYSVQKKPYVPLGSATSVTNGQLWDEEIFHIPIGFTFTLGNTKIDSLYMAGPTFICYKNHDSEFSGFWTIDADLCDRGIHDSSASVSPISYSLVGITGNRIFKIEFSNAGFWEEMKVYGTNNDFINLQVWLFEADNSVELHFGPSQISNPQSYFFFGNQPSACYLDRLGFDTDYYANRVYYLHGDPAAPTLDSTADILQTQTLDHIPVSETVYRFRHLPNGLSDATRPQLDAHIYPTPCNDKLYINNRCSGTIKYALKTITGYSTPVQGQALRGSNTIDVGAIPQGTYILNLADTGNLTNIILIKQ